MKILRFLGVVLICGLSLAATEIKPTPLPPPLLLKDAVRVAEDHIARKKIDISHHYLASVRIESDKRGQLHGDAQWMLTEKTMKGGWFIIRVGMDESATVIVGK